MPGKYDFDKEVSITVHEFTGAVATAMHTEPYASMAKEVEGIENVFFAFSSRVAGILFEGRI